MANASVAQRALTVVATIRGGAAERDALVALLDGARERVLERLAAVSTLHFGRLVVIDRADGRSALVLESNYDGDERDHLAELELRVGADLDLFFACCEGYEAGKLVDLVARSAAPYSAFYVGHGGLTVQQIRNDEAVRRALEAELDALDAGGKLASMQPRALADALKGVVSKAGLAVGAVDRQLPKQPWAKLSLYAMVPGMVLAALGLAGVAAVVYEPADRRGEAKAPPKLVPDHDSAVDALIDAEDLAPQNGLTHVVPLKAGVFREKTTRFVLWVVEMVHTKALFEGNLSGIATIHFARWVLLPDGTLVFFSNYDGSWESYLGDFVDKAHLFLTAIWTNTRWFPKTYALVLGGASAASTFKQWTRTFQVRNQIWYSAYDGLTVTNILRNAKIRELAGGAFESEADASAWLALL